MTYSPLLIRRPTDATYRVSRYDSDFLLEFENKATVVFPEAEDDQIPVGMQVAITAIEEPVLMDPEGSVAVRGSMSMTIKQFHVAVLTKVAPKFWLVALNTSDKDKAS